MEKSLNLTREGERANYYVEFLGKIVFVLLRMKKLIGQIYPISLASVGQAS